ncbi:MAG: S-layer homology domain-containing protein [Scytolyngbya sp. HA4215-MV1]|jgi:hypothetical protein|nr:S-layer homology domain-containing protein [Scytolyngbya sp. HA4215-MV1]
MYNSNRFQTGTALLLALGLTTSAIAPLVVAAPASAQTTFSDVSANYWASGFIQELATRGVIKGFPDGSFRPNDPVTRAQFAAMVRQAFNATQVRNSTSFVDVPTDYWAYSAIQEAYTTGFMTGYPGSIFNPNQSIPRAQVLVSLTSGLKYTSTTSASTVLQVYNDANEIPGYATESIAAATERQLVVNYPDVKYLNPNQTATRAEVAAFIYQALSSTGSASALTSPYIVGQAPQPTQVRIPSGTVIPVKYTKAAKILLAQNEPKPTPLTLTVAQNIVTSKGVVLIPAGSEVVGELRIVQGGAQFVASELVLASGQRYPLGATSEVVTTTETIRKGASLGTVLKDTALGAAAAAGISAVTGDRAIATEEVLAGAGVGALLGLFLGRDKVDLISIRPDTDLSLTLSQDLVLR